MWFSLEEKQSSGTVQVDIFSRNKIIKLQIIKGLLDAQW